MSRKKKLTGIAVAILLVIALMAGTFAWTDFTQHRTNAFAVNSATNVTLNDAFVPPMSWNETESVDKSISVTNTSTNNDFIYVRLQLKEYMASVVDGGLIMAGGKPVLFATYASGPKIGHYIRNIDDEAAAAIAGFNYIAHPITYAADYPDTEVAGQTVIYYETTNDELKNGIYGKAMSDTSTVEVFGSSVRADYPNQEHEGQVAGNVECDYEIHYWPATSSVAALPLAEICDITAPTLGSIHDFITWNLGSQVITLADWQTAGSLMGDFWVLDADGWAYWANGLAPGATTEKLMESVLLDGIPGPVFEYYIHTELEAATLDELPTAFERPDSSVSAVVSEFVAANASPYVVNGVAVNGVTYGVLDGTATRYMLTGSTYGPNNTFISSGDEITAGLDGISGTADDGAIVNPAGTALRTGVTISRAVASPYAPYIELGNGFILSPGADGKIGTKDDMVNSFGSFAQDTTVFTTKEVLDWRLLDIDDVTDPDNPTAILVTDKVLSNLKYNVGVAAGGRDGNLWETSNLRAWLNSDTTLGFVSGKTGETTGFYDAAFTTAQKALIVDTKVSMAAEQNVRVYLNAAPSGSMSLVSGSYSSATYYNVNISAGTDTVDKVWALSAEEVWEYFGRNTNTTPAGYNTGNHTAGYAKGNTYAWTAAGGATYKEPNTTPWLLNNSYYWLRSPGQDASRASLVRTYGSVGATNGVANATVGARPAITVKLVP